MALPILLWIIGGVIATGTTAAVAHDRGKDEGKREATEKATAKAAVKIKILEEDVRKKEDEIEKIKEEVHNLVQKIAKHYNGQRKFEQFIICVIAAGVAMAACDGDIDENEVRDLREYVFGALGKALPVHLETKIEQLFDAPPNFEQAMLYVEALDQEIWPMIDTILQVVSEADGEVMKSERVFLKQWEAYKTTSKLQTVLSPTLDTSLVEDVNVRARIQINKA